VTVAAETELAELRAERDRAVLRRRASDALLQRLARAGEAVVFGTSGEPANPIVAEDNRRQLGEAVTDAWMHLRPTGAEPATALDGWIDTATDLLYRAWTVIANAGHHRGGWDVEHPEWVEAAEKWRDAWLALDIQAGPPEAPLDPLTRPTVTPLTVDEPTHDEVLDQHRAVTAAVDGAERIEITPSVARLMAGIARGHSAVTYDANDRYAAMIEAAARQAGLVPVPSDTIQPRTIRGCQLPPGVEPAALQSGPAVEAALTALVDAARPILTSLHAGGRAAGRVGAVHHG
jgi:hypothetical protein